MFRESLRIGQLDWLFRTHNINREFNMDTYRDVLQDIIGDKETYLDSLQNIIGNKETYHDGHQDIIGETCLLEEVKDMSDEVRIILTILQAQLSAVEDRWDALRSSQ